MHAHFDAHLTSLLSQLQADGLLKPERVLTSPQGAWVETGGRRVINLCANNYLGLSGRPELVEAGKRALERHGFGLSSVRFICGTQDVHKALEARLAAFLGFEDAILFSSCFDANGGVFEALLGEEDAVAVGHTSGHWVKPKNMTTAFPLKSPRRRTWPLWSVNSKSLA